jgi:cytochrome P450
MNRDWLGSYANYAHEYGDVVSYRIGPFRMALISEPRLIEQVVVGQAHKLKKSGIQQLIHPLIGDGIFLSEGDAWKRQRRLVSPPFHRQRIAMYGDLMVKSARAMLDEYREGELRDIYRDTTKLALTIVSTTLFDADLHGSMPEVERVLADAMEALSSRLDTPLPLPNWVPTPALRRLKRARERLDRVIDAFIEQRRRSDGSGKDLLSLLLAARDADTGGQLTARQVRDEAVTIFVAGFETTAIAMAWAFWLLARHPDVAARLRSEITSVLQGRLPTSDDLPRLGLLDGVVHEALRLYPPAWVFARDVLEDVQVGGYVIPKGWSVEFSQWVTHRDPRLWQEPHRFVPTRWENDLASKLPRFAYFPFGGGHRVCIGNAFAMMEIALVIATVLPRVNFEAIDPADVVPEPGFTLRPKQGVPLRVVGLRSSSVVPEVASAS